MSVLPTGKRTYMKSQERRAQILACARAVFSKKGFHGTSVADICTEAGIGRGTLYQHFGNKRDVFFAVVDEIADRVSHVIESRVRIAAMDGVAAAPPQLVAGYCARRLRELLDAVFADEASVRLVLREARGLDGGVDRLVARVDAAVLEAFVSDLEVATELGIIDCDDPRMTATFVMGGVEKLVLTALESDTPLDLDRIVTVAIRVQLFGLLGDRTRGLGAPHNDTHDNP